MLAEEIGYVPLTWATLGSLLMAWIGCYFPWTATTGRAFTVNLFDLAEWTSLDPAVRGGNPPLLATFLLRATVGLIAIALAIKAGDAPNRAVRWGLWILALLVGVGLLPPLDFFRGALDDPNYRQQFVIALIMLISIGAAIFFGRRRLPLSTKWRGGRGVRLWLGNAIIITALIFGVLGAVLGVQALSAFGLHLTPGLGSAITALALVCAIIFNLLSNTIELRRQS